MKKLFFFAFALGLCQCVTARIAPVATDLGGGEALFEFIQEEPNPAGVGGLLIIDIEDGFSDLIRDLWIIPRISFDPPSATLYGWDWISDIHINDEGDIELSAIPNQDAGTPGVGSLMDPIRGTTYTCTAFFVAPFGAVNWNLETPFPLTGQWDGVVYEVPEPSIMALLGLGGIILGKNRKQVAN